MRPLIVGNWKMHGMAPQLGEIEAVAASAKATPPSADILICLPATLIARAVQTADGRIAIGGEDCSTQIAGPFTGDLSAEMLKDAGANAVIVGHSERRQHHGETDAVVVAKAEAAKRAGLLAIICIGETNAQRLAGKALSVCGNQIAGSVTEGMTSSGGEVERGVALCGSGVGASVAANKVSGVRAALIHNVFSARQGVEDDAMNVFCLGGKVIGSALALKLITTFLTARFSNAARHRRLAKVQALETDKTGPVIHANPAYAGNALRGHPNRSHHTLRTHATKWKRNHGRRTHIDASGSGPEFHYAGCRRRPDVARRGVTADERLSCRCATS